MKLFFLNIKALIARYALQWTDFVFLFSHQDFDKTVRHKNYFNYYDNSYLLIK